MADFQKITCHRLNPPVTVSAITGKVTFDDHEFTVPEWNTWHDKVNRTLIHLGLKPKINRPPATTYGGHPFLIKNLDAINKRKKGYIKPAPWFLRPFFSGVVTKETYEPDI